MPGTHLHTPQPDPILSAPLPTSCVSITSQAQLRGVQTSMHSVQ